MQRYVGFTGAAACLLVEGGYWLEGAIGVPGGTGVAEAVVCGLLEGLGVVKGVEASAALGEQPGIGTASVEFYVEGLVAESNGNEVFHSFVVKDISSGAVPSPMAWTMMWRGNTFGID